MRKRIWIPSTLALIVCLAFLLWPRRHSDTKIAVQNATLTNQQEQAQQAKGVETHRATNAAGNVSKPPPNNEYAEAVAKTNPYAGRVLEAWQTPIDFYGKVVDNNSNPVAGAQITFRWMEIPDQNGSRSSNTVSDSGGLFSLRGAKGPSVSVYVSKAGYYTSKATPTGYKYMDLLGDGFHPDAQNPVIFTLRKKGNGEPLVWLKHNYLIPRDGTPVSVNLVSGAMTRGQNGNLVVQCWTQDQGKKPGEKYDWRCLITIPGGGLVPTDEEFAFLAPDNGYQASVAIEMPTNRPHWHDDVELKLYYQLSDGRYGKMGFSMISGGQNFFMIDSVLNPTGSRDLEPAQ